MSFAEVHHQKGTRTCFPQIAQIAQKRFKTSYNASISGEEH
jgi:hypothetical protein